MIANGYSFKDHGERKLDGSRLAAHPVEDRGIAAEQAAQGVLRVPLKQGRWLDRSDVGEGIPSVLVNETAARRLWPGEGAVGKRFWPQHNTNDSHLTWVRSRGLDTSMIGRPYEVVGVVGDTVEYAGKEVVAARYPEGPQPIIYRALENVQPIEIAESCLFVRTAVNPGTLYKPIVHAINATGANAGMPMFFDLQEVLRAGMAGHRTVMLYLCIFASVGLFLAAIGLYGVLAYSVARRTREIGIRMALGAPIVDVMRLILGQGLVLVAVGGVIGIITALATGRVLRAYLFGVSSTDPVTFIAVALLLAVVALFACWLPARRATRVNPIDALRYE